MNLATVTHDIASNTLEATWVQQTETEVVRVKRRNYSVEQKAEFLADCGEGAEKYTIMAGW